MNSISIWEESWQKFQSSPYSSGSTVPASLSEIFHHYEEHLVLKTLQLNHEMKVLDIGAGCGRWTVSFAPRTGKVIAIEPTPAFQVLKKNTADFANVECINISFGEYETDEKFDLIIISGVLMYINEQNEYDNFLLKALSMIAPSGHLILREPVGRVKQCKKIGEIQKQDKPDCIEHMEITRTKMCYHAPCKSNNMHLIRFIPSHATVFYHVNLPVFNTLIQKLAPKIFNRRHLTFWYCYNACFNKLEGLVRYALNIPKFHLMIYKKRA